MAIKFDAEASTVALYTFTEGSGNSVADSSGNAYTLSLQAGATSWGTDDRFGAYMIFGGSTVLGYMAQAAALEVQTLTVEMIIRYSDYPAASGNPFGYVVQGAPSDGRGWYYTQAGTGVAVFQLGDGDGSWDDAAGSTVIPRNQWFYHAFSYDGAAQRLWRCGEADGSTNNATTILYTPIGGYPSNTCIFLGASASSGPSWGSYINYLHAASIRVSNVAKTSAQLYAVQQTLQICPTAGQYLPTSHGTFGVPVSLGSRYHRYKSIRQAATELGQLRLTP